MKNIEEIIFDDQLLAIIIYSNFNKKGIHFFTEDDLSQQLAFMNHPEGKLIQPHTHNEVIREVNNTQEVLFIRKGKLKIDFYTQNQQYIKSKILEAGDVILLIQGGHGFKVLEEVEMFEVKQGPYSGDLDKTRFSPPAK